MLDASLLLGWHKHMIGRLRSLGIRNQLVLAALEKIPRYQFVELAFQTRAHDPELALPIAEQQTISQPYIVARMTEALLSDKSMPKHLLEIGTGSGYQTALLAAILNGTITSLERIETLHTQARATMRKMRHLLNIVPNCVLADGHAGYSQAAPFDAIVITAACMQDIPQPLVQQLKVGGVLVAPIQKEKRQWLVYGTKKANGTLLLQTIEEVVFVPMLQGVA